MGDLLAWNITYTDVLRGRTVDLDNHDAGLYTLAPLLGVGMPPVQHDSEAVFDAPGEVWRQTKFAMREMTIPLAIIQPDEGLIMERLRALASALRPTNHPAPGYLTFVHENYQESARRIWCQYAGGMQTSISPYRQRNVVDPNAQAQLAETWIEHALVFRAFDPLFEDVMEEVEDFITAGGSAFFPMFADPDDVGPHFSGSSIFEQRTVENDGDVSCFPLFEITGPASSLVLENLTTDQHLDLSRNGGLNVVAGQTITVDMRPASRGIERDDGTNGIPYLTDDSQFWALQPGSNVVNIQAIDATAESRVQLRMRHRRLTL